MVFAKLQDDEKEAFFSLLDEYFASRPDVFGRLAATSSSDGSGAGAGYSGAASAAASAAHRAFGSSVGPKYGLGVTKSTSSNDPEPEPEVNSSVAGRIAAFSSGRSNDNVPPQRTAPPPIAQKPAGASGLVSSKKLGDLDTSSKGAMFGSLYHGNKNKNSAPAAPPQPPAFPPKKNMFAPPPGHNSTPERPALPARQPEPEPEPEPEEESQGEWALALYDYDSQEAGDLQIKENEHVLVTERTSDDWWTGEYNGRKGLFPASYVKLV